MENKYYTPSIEEFCVGFQYEKRVNNIGEKVEAYFAVDGDIVKVPDYICTEEDWAGKEFSLSNSEEQNIEKLIEEGRLRVKYLTKEDIESLGFKNILGNDIYSIEQNDITYHLIPISSYRFEIRPSHPSNIYGGFLGTIKNKHELKRVLTMLGILK